MFVYASINVKIFWFSRTGVLSNCSKEDYSLTNHNDEKKLLYSSAYQLGINLTEDQIESLCILIDLLIEWNGKINLVGTSDRSRILNELVLDSLIPVPYLPEKGDLMDFGSGSGFPALIIKILKPGLQVNLIESNHKKVSFLKYAIHSLKLKRINVVNKRIEALAEKSKLWGCDIVTSRAMASLEKIVEYSTPFLRPEGIIVGFLGKDGDTELKDIRDILSCHQLIIKKTIPYTLPEKETERTAVLLQKTAASKYSPY